MGRSDCTEIVSNQKQVSNAGLFKKQKQADCEQNLDVTQKVTLSTCVFGKNLLGIKKKGEKKLPTIICRLDHGRCFVVCYW